MSEKLYRRSGETIVCIETSEDNREINIFYANEDDLNKLKHIATFDIVMLWDLMKAAVSTMKIKDDEMHTRLRRKIEASVEINPKTISYLALQTKG